MDRGLNSSTAKCTSKSTSVQRERRGIEAIKRLTFDIYRCFRQAQNLQRRDPRITKAVFAVYARYYRGHHTAEHFVA